MEVLIREGLVSTQKHKEKMVHLIQMPSPELNSLYRALGPLGNGMPPLRPSRAEPAAPFPSR